MMKEFIYTQVLSLMTQEQKIYKNALS